MIELIFTDPYKADVVCHSGVFHADDVFSTVLLAKMLGSPLYIARVNSVPIDLPERIIVYDIGGGRFDHHQKGGNGVREESIPYASFGLLWMEYGSAFCRQRGFNPEYVVPEFDRFISGIDGYDNGLFHQKSSPVMNLSKCIALFNPSWEENTPESFSNAFSVAVNFAETIFDKVMTGIVSRFHAKTKLIEELEKATSDVLYLDQFVPFSALPEMKDRIHTIVYPSIRGGYNVQIINNFYSFPKRILGLSKDELRITTKIPTALFAHNSGKLAGAETFEDIERLIALVEVLPDDNVKEREENNNSIEKEVNIA